MLAGKKPLAVFNRLVGEDFDPKDGQPFEDHVAAGRLSRHRFYARITIAGKDRKQFSVAYCLPGEEWRVPVYRQLMRSLHSDTGSPWSEDMETIQGTLLGYTISEMTEHLALWREGK